MASRPSGTISVDALLRRPVIEPSLLMVAATEGESFPVALHLRYPVRKTCGRRHLITGRLAGLPARLMVTGPGMANTIQALTAAVEARPPCMIVMIGCAGAFTAAGLDVGDIGIATEEIDAHLGIEGETGDGIPTPLPFPVLPPPGMAVPGRYPLHWLTEETERCLEHAFRAEKIRVKTGPFLTVSTVTATDRRAARLFDIFHPIMENMEGAGAAHVAALYGIPFLEIRCASNRVGARDRAAWELSTAADRCGQAVLTLTDLLKDHLAHHL
jgi:futalosine hydrolase